MKNILKKIVRKILRKLAKAILAKYKPQIIGITGSVGKTSAREAIYSVLFCKYKTRQNIKNYNNEIGLPLTIIGSTSGGRSIWDWIGVFMKALILLIWKDKEYPEILVLEMAVDRPGDMRYLIDLAPCRVGVITNIGPVHLEFFNTVEKIAKEKSLLVSHINKNGWVILNNDNEHTAEMTEAVRARRLTFGINSKSDVMAKEINISQEPDGMFGSDIAGLSFKLSHGGSTVPVLLPDILGEHLIYAALAAASVGIVYGMNLVEISQCLRKFVAPKGRMKIIDGIKDTTIIDDTYNAGPTSMEAGLDVLAKIKTEGKKIAVLGDMLELGSFTVEAHSKVGQQVAKEKIDILITVGERAKTIATEAKNAGMNGDNIFTFAESSRAGRFLQDKMEQGDVIFVKGSQGVRMEKIVKEVMNEPLKAVDLLVRQDEGWKNR